MKKNKYSQLVNTFNSEKEQIITKIKGEDYEIKGVLFSEAVFVYLVSKGVGNINKLIESGRARAQSTTLFAKLFTDKKIVSVEYNKASPDVEVANKRLATFGNVSTIYGDSFIEIPKVLEQDDVVFIDGPKMFDAVILALKLLATGKPNAVFLHDTSFDTPERFFLDLFFQSALHSDNRELAKVTSILDANINNTIPERYQLNNTNSKEYGYGYNISCIFKENKSYNLYIILAKMFDLYNRLVTKLNNIKKIIFHTK